jgi:hypothetical protein
MRPPVTSAGWSRPVRLAIVLGAVGGTCIVAGVAVAYLIADHSYSDSSPSSLTAIGLGEAGIAALALSGALLSGIGLARLRHRRQRLHRDQ